LINQDFLLYGNRCGVILADVTGVFQSIMKYSFLLFLIFFTCCVQAQPLEIEDQESVKKFIGYIRDHHPDSIASEMVFPMQRQYPLPEVKDSADFMNRFSQIFDKELTKKITESNVAEDWSHVGWRGIMLLRGDLWLDEEGRLVAVNHHSKYEMDWREQLIKSEKASLHPSIQDYADPVCILETETYRVRIDKLQNHKFRYTSWKKEAENASKPDLIIMDGEIKFDGSGGNHTYTFFSEEYKYEVYIEVIGDGDSPPAAISMYKQDQKILSWPATFKAVK
jgi:hypothetical protein